MHPTDTTDLDEARIAAAQDEYDDSDCEGSVQSEPDSIAAICARTAAEIEAGERQLHPSTAESKASPLTFIDPATLGDASPTERRWIVEGWLPAGTVTLLYSAGGEGKSLLALQLATACATGRSWLGIQPEQCRAMLVMCEDDSDELHRRQRAINAELRVSMRDLRDMRWASPVGADNTLVRFGPNGAPTWTDRFLEIRDAAMDFRPGLLVLDTAADLYGGNENDRGQVSQFLKTGLGGLARDTGAASALYTSSMVAGLIFYSPTKCVTLWCFGDSLTEGVTSGGNYGGYGRYAAALLASTSGVAVSFVDGGYSAQTTAQITARLADLLAAGAPCDILTLPIDSPNDYGQAPPVPRVQQEMNMLTAMDGAFAKGASVGVLLTPLPFYAGIGDGNNASDRIASGQKVRTQQQPGVLTLDAQAIVCGYVPTAANPPLTPANLRGSDGAHLNATAQNMLGNALAAVIAPSLAA